MAKKDGKKKPMMALVISVGPKMPKKPEDTATPDGKAMKKAWGFLKADESYTGQPKFGGNQKQPLDMVEYPEGSGNFMSLRDMLEARNAQSRANLERTRAMTGRFGEDYANRQQMREQREADNAAYRLLRQKKFNETQGSPLTHGSGRYDPNNPDAMHPMGSGQ